MIEEAEEWLSKLISHEIPLRERISFSGFYSKKEISTQHKCINELLPFLEDSVNSLGMAKHCMMLVEKLVSTINSHQDPVITADQPVYALGKRVQWMYPDRFKNVVCMMSRLHIEMALLNAIDDWLEGSGWLGVFNKAKISTSGRVDSFLSESHVKRSRYAHLISLFALLSMAMAQEVFQESGCSSYEDWENQLKSKSVNTRYWFIVLEHETLLFIFIRSWRSADFDLFRRCLKEIIPWMFALDHAHYSMPLSVFHHDLERLGDTNEKIFQNFMEGRFVVNKSGKAFSCIAEDQAHKQNNKRIEGDGDAVGILYSEEALLKWAISGPPLAKILEQGETKKLGKNARHEDTDLYEKTFQEEGSRYLESFKAMANPSREDEECLVNIESKNILRKDVSESVKSANVKGKKQSKEFIENCLANGTKSLYDSISKNKLQLFGQRNDIAVSKKSQEINSLKSDCHLCVNLYKACQVRKGDLEEFFLHENHSYPPAISENEKLRKCNIKSDFLGCVKEIHEPSRANPTVECSVIDGAAFVNAHQPRTSKNFEEHCEREIKQNISYTLEHASRVDLVFNMYRDITTKGAARAGRGKCVRVFV